jgi:hypothetical protein
MTMKTITMKMMTSNRDMIGKSIGCHAPAIWPLLARPSKDAVHELVTAHGSRHRGRAAGHWRRARSDRP